MLKQSDRAISTGARPSKNQESSFPRIQVLKTCFFSGPNRWSYRPTFEALIDLGILENYPSNKIPGLYQRLKDLLPGLYEHGCSYSCAGGFLKRLEEGTWPGHILEHVAIELQTLSRIPRGFGRTRDADKPGRYFVAFNSPNLFLAEKAFSVALEIVFATMNDLMFDLTSELEALTSIAHHYCYGHSTQAIVDEAIRNAIPRTPISYGYNLVQLGYGSKQRRIWSAETDVTSAVAADLSTDKHLTKELLAACGIPTPKGQMVTTLEGALSAAKNLGFPLCIKPLNANKRRGVVLDIQDESQLIKAFKYARSYRDELVIEKFVSGTTQRLLVINHKLVAASTDSDLFIIGNGKDTVETLIQTQINAQPDRGRNEFYGFVSIETDDRVLITLSKQGLDFDSVPEKNHKILIQRFDGGYTDCTPQVHPTIAEHVELASRIIGLDIAAIDLIAQDITKPLEEQQGALLEINARPALQEHITPDFGEAQPVGQSIINMLFKDKEQAFMPLVSICGSSTSPMLAHLIGYMLQHQKNLYTGVYAQNETFYNGQKNRNPYRLSDDQRHHVLCNPCTQAAVIETSYDDLLLRGLPHDYASISILTDVEPDMHLGKNHITRQEQLHEIFRTIVDVVMPTGSLMKSQEIRVFPPKGHAILNADNAFVCDMAQHCHGHVIYFSQLGRRENSSSVWLEDKNIVISGPDTPQETILDVTQYSVPIQVLLCGIATAWALGIPLENFSSMLDDFLLNHGKKV